MVGRARTNDTWVMEPVRIEPTEDRYPAGLRDLAPPPIIQLRGRGDLPAPVVAIVGARRPTFEAQRFAEGLARELAGIGVSVVSGGAMGIDRAAHVGALAAGGATWAVLAGSLEDPHPRCHGALFRQILAQGGGLLAEADRPRGRGEFVLRNRLVAALAQLVIVVQGGATSGTRHTVEFARRLGRSMGAVPWCPWDPRGATALQMWGLGAQPVGSPEDVFRILACEPPERSHLPPVIAALGSGGVTLDALVRKLGQDPREVRRELERLQWEGRVERRAGRYWARY